MDDCGLCLGERNIVLGADWDTFTRGGVTTTLRASQLRGHSYLSEPSTHYFTIKLFGPNADSLTVPVLSFLFWPPRRFREWTVRVHRGVIGERGKRTKTDQNININNSSSRTTTSNTTNNANQRKPTQPTQHREHTLLSRFITSMSSNEGSSGSTAHRFGVRIPTPTDASSSSNQEAICSCCGHALSSCSCGDHAAHLHSGSEGTGEHKSTAHRFGMRVGPVSTQDHQ